MPTAAEVQAVPLAALHPAAWNPRTIKDERFQNLCASIEADPDFLWRRPVVAQADGTIYAGNMRYRAAQQLGLETVPAIVEDIADQLARERAMRDNAQWGEWEEDDLAKLLDELKASGSDLGLLGFDERELQKLLNLLDQQGGLTDADHIPEPPEEPVSKVGDLWLLGDHRVLCGDSTDHHDVKIVMNGEKARLMATDPPYLVDYTGGNHPDSKANRPELVARAAQTKGRPNCETNARMRDLEHPGGAHLTDRGVGCHRSSRRSRPGPLAGGAGRWKSYPNAASASMSDRTTRARR